MFSAYSALMRARAGSGAPGRGLCRMGALLPEIYAVLRWLPESGEQALLLINRSERKQQAALQPDDLPQGADGETPVAFNEMLKDVLSGETVHITDGELVIKLPPLTARLYRTME
ncbi:MAG: hypothetical protein R2912_07720 [Eubacteriales bacterium]